MCFSRSLIFGLALLSCLQCAVADDSTAKIYQQHCAGCHGVALQGGSGGSLLVTELQYGKTSQAIQAAIQDGIAEAGMPGWGTLFDEKRIQQLAAFILEHGAKPKISDPDRKTFASSNRKGKRFQAAGHDFYLHTLAEGEGRLWGMDFLPDTSVLVTQKDGVLWHFVDQKRQQITGIPQVIQKGQGGLLDIVVHPEYATNKNKRWIYLSYSAGAHGHQAARKGSMTKVVRGKIKQGKWQDQQTIFEVTSSLFSTTKYHFGSRFVIHNGYIYFSIGDRGRQNHAQDLGRPNGKIFRLHDDGRIPKDNPFVNHREAMPEIWSFGHRNPQGLALDKATGLLWSSEHGPRGGDEINIIRKGRNYGWPKITYGINYNGTSITDKTALPGMEQPELYWTPSIAVAGIDIYSGEHFPKWRGKLLAGGMKSEELHLLTLRKPATDGGKNVAEDVIILKNQGRIRDLSTAPDGSIYLLVNHSGEHGKLMRLSSNGTL